MNHPFSLTGRTILVTGASSGIGRQTCITIAQMGGTVIATGRDRERLAETLAALQGQGHSSFPADLVNAADRAALLKAMPPLDGIVHGAGIVKHTTLAYASEAKLDELVAINYKAPMLLTQGLAKARQIRDGASIVFISSSSALFAVKAIGIYAATKGAILAHARVLALELAPRKIRVNCLAPALVLTPIAVQTAKVVTEEVFADHEKDYPLGFGKPEDVAHAAVFLLSEAGRWITGSTIVLDGGYTCK